MLAFGRVATPGPRIVLALDHPDFGFNSLPEIRDAYCDCIAPSAQPGISVILCEPERNALRRLELIEHLSPSEVKLGVGGFIIPGEVIWHYESAARSDCFGGWPSVALVPTTPCRLLKLDVRTMWPGAIPEVNVRAASVLHGAAGYAPDVQFLRFGALVNDENTTLQQLGQWAEQGEQVEVRIGFGGEHGRGDGDAIHVPVRFEPSYALEGQRAAREALASRRPLREASKTIVAFLGLAAVLGGVVYTLRTRVHWKLDALRKELSSDGLSEVERDAKVARWLDLQRRLHSSSNGKGGTNVSVDYASFEPVPKPPGAVCESAERT